EDRPGVNDIIHQCAVHVKADQFILHDKKKESMSLNSFPVKKLATTIRHERVASSLPLVAWFARFFSASHTTYFHTPKVVVCKTCKTFI
ncbi:hypothetical protein J4453_01275, partial [Candidatus Woesearchaeota archaeon]|nr:hypothetical protein [Candidatus Woesearchaeota archaeon]